MKRWMVVLLAIVGATFGVIVGNVRADIFADNARLGRGINFGNALDAPTEGAWGVVLKASYFKAVRDAGFDTVRLPVKWSAHAKRTAPYTIDETFARRVDWAINQARANHLNIIVNVHHYDGMDNDPDHHVDRLIGLWQQIATRYKDQPASVYFELLNEPHNKLTEAKWNTIIPRLLRVVRETNPTRPVIVGPGQWNSTWALDKFHLPADDHHLILTVHSYDPFHFTHQGADFVPGAKRWQGTHWNGTPREEAEIRRVFEKAAAWGKTHHRPVFLGEFGSIGNADTPSRARWTRYVVHEAEQLGFSWAYWEFCSGFGAYNPRTDEWREPIKAALIAAN